MKMMVYNLKKVSKDTEEKKNREKESIRNTTPEGNSKYLIILFWLGRGQFLYLIRIITLPNHPRLLPLL